MLASARRICIARCCNRQRRWWFQEADGLRDLRKRCGPVALLAMMRSCQSRLALLISGQG